MIDYSEGFKLLHQLDELKNQITELSSRLEEIQRQLQHNEYIQKTLKHNRAIETVINYLNYSQKVDLQTKLNKYQEQITQAFVGCGRSPFADRRTSGKKKTIV